MKDIFSIGYYLATISWPSSYVPSPRRSHFDGPQGRLDSVIDPYIYILDRVEVAHSIFAHLRFFQYHSLYNTSLVLYMIGFIMFVWAYEACFWEILIMFENSPTHLGESFRRFAIGFYSLT